MRTQDRKAPVLGGRYVRVVRLVENRGKQCGAERLFEKWRRLFLFPKTPDGNIAEIE